LIQFDQQREKGRPIMFLLSMSFVAIFTGCERGEKLYLQQLIHSNYELITTMLCRVDVVQFHSNNQKYADQGASKTSGLGFAEV